MRGPHSRGYTGNPLAAVAVQLAGVARASRPWITRKMRVPHLRGYTGKLRRLIRR